jgi:hypothetical protein
MNCNFTRIGIRNLLCSILICTCGLAVSAPEEITILLPGDVPLVMVRIPAGSFQMVSQGDAGWEYLDERPVHTVNIACNFSMGRYELTQQQWLAVMGSWPHGPPDRLGGVHGLYHSDDAHGGTGAGGPAAGH